ncbi:PREDICTED: uncharacterized protein LOC105453385 [Wasmannia auropunctata]|uniref:uncharacterized protein LOC105453385 n=1 Tax=Wasmannia auropunctata TaxID=64793 RepID=UPI0005EDA142|nr:PREDICTED: uncharacterized protein LOC105453385 [Wasmannia auropunctata]XP_011693601.1 PREDICTED: uncharacterized protein LOC105453385 [Wasmannia auropunctata]XP_011693602.1 PREDICTED: uncharacterized protein LOC105453385 [Wasmannia auropunctata]
MAQETPAWLNVCFVEKILRKSEGDNSIQVIDIFSKPATAKGDNYTSDMIRVTAEFSRDQGRKTEKKSIIVKVSPIVEGVRQELIEQSGIFKVEILMMSDTLDKMNKLLGPKHRISGKGLYVQNANPTLLVIEDLAPLGFRMADRLAGLDLAHCILALRGIARFHAASVALCEKEPNQKTMYNQGGMFSDQHPPEMGAFFTMSVKGLAEEIATWPGMKKYADKIAKLTDEIYQIGINAAKMSEDEFNVINHGDMWVNNMLFKYDNDGKPVEHIFVDFQMCVYTSPALDLLYFISTSPSPDIIENKRDILLNEYLGTLSATMAQLNCKTQPPTMEELKATMKRRASYGMIASFSVLPMVLCCKSEVKDLDELMSKDNFSNPGFKSESYKKLMMKRLPLYDEWGLLDP